VVLPESPWEVALNRALTILSLAGGLLLGACSGPDEDIPRLEFLSSMPKTLAVGDTTGLLEVKRIYADARGRQQETPDYRSFVFSSDDTTVVQVVDGRRLLGLKAGTAGIVASDATGARTKNPAIVKVE
jgi:hypothetical protein